MQTTITGKVWVLSDSNGKLIDNIDTDMIFHNRYLHITAIEEMGPYTLDNLTGWEDFASRAAPGDIVVAGSNFGCGSSRQQAVDCFRALGIAALVARSYGAIYFRNAVNAGWPVLACPTLADDTLANGSSVTIDLDTGSWQQADGTPLPELAAVSSVQREIMAAGGLFNISPAGSR